MTADQPTAQFCAPADALAFDVDGTLADTDPVHARAWLAAFEQVTGRRGFSTDDYVAACVRGAMSPKAFLTPLTSVGEWPRIKAAKRHVYAELLSAGIDLATGLLDLVRAAQAARVRIAIVSSSSPESVDALLSRMWTPTPPDVVVCRGDTPDSKPSGGPYRRALQLLGLPSDHVVAFEDADAGVCSARTAGIRCVRLGRTDPGEADFAIKDFRDCRLVTHGSQRWLRI